MNYEKGDKFLDLKNQIYILANSGHFQMTLINLKRWYSMGRTC